MVPDGPPFRDAPAPVSLRSAAPERPDSAQHVEREAVLALQRRILPTTLPVLPHVRLAARYGLAHAVTRGGGDWFDAAVTDGGLVALVAGDVVGHGPAAVAAMAELRAVLRAGLLADPARPGHRFGRRDVGTALAAAVAALDGHAARDRRTRAATVAAALLDPATGEVVYTACGHPPPLLCGLGRARPLPPTGGGPLGIGAGPHAVRGARLAPGQSLLLYTDGLVERPGCPLADGIARIGRAAAATGPDPERLCDAVLDALPGGGLTDDVAVVAATRRVAPVPPVTAEIPAEAGELAGLRSILTDWLGALDVTADGHTAVPLVVSELVSNAVQHAYRDGPPGRVRLHAALDGRGGARVTVADTGRWRPPVPGRTGRAGGFGLAVARDLSDSVDIATGSGGTTVTVVCPLAHPVAVGAAAPVRRLGAVAHPDLTTVERPGARGVLVVRGPVDEGTVGTLRQALAQGTAGGTVPAVLDLAGVTILASAGVRLLHELAALPAPPRILAPAGSVSRHVLALTGLGHLVDEPS